MSGCNVNDVPSTAPVDAREAIEIKAGAKIRVELEKVSNKDIYTIHYQEYLPPTITVSYKGAVAKVGTTIASATIDGSINPGSEDIVERTMTPDKGFSLTAPISYVETNVTGTTPGLWPRYSGVPTVFTAKDATGTVVTKQVGVEFRHLYYMIYSTKESLSDNDVTLVSATQDLLTSILNKYSTFTYNYSTQPTYIYWVFPADSTVFTTASEGPLPVPLKLDCAPIMILESGVNKQYKVIRTAVKTKFVNSTITLH